MNASYDRQPLDWYSRRFKAYKSALMHGWSRLWCTYISAGSEILPCRGRRVGPCRTCRGETCTGCVCMLRSHLNLAICLCPKYLLTFSWLKSSYSKSDWVLGTQKHLILILFSAITLRNKETEGVELFCPAERCCIKKSPNLLANGTWF